MANIEIKNPKQNPISLLQINLPFSFILFLQGTSGRKKLVFKNLIAANTKEIDANTNSNILIVESDVLFAKKKQAKE